MSRSVGGGRCCPVPDDAVVEVAGVPLAVGVEVALVGIELAGAVVATVRNAVGVCVDSSRVVIDEPVAVVVAAVALRRRVGAGQADFGP